MLCLQGHVYRRGGLWPGQLGQSSKSRHRWPGSGKQGRAFSGVRSCARGGVGGACLPASRAPQEFGGPDGQVPGLAQGLGEEDKGAAGRGQLAEP